MSIDQQIINGELFVLSFENYMETDGLYLWKKMQEGAFYPVGNRFLSSKYNHFLPSMRIKEPLPKVFYRTSTLLRTLTLLRKMNTLMYNDSHISIHEKLKAAILQMPSSKSFLEEQFCVHPLVIEHIDGFDAQMEAMSFCRSLKNMNNLAWTEGDEMKSPCIKSFLFTLMSIGAFELACLPFNRSMETPLEAIKAYRLTKFGQYVFGHQDKYDPNPEAGEKEIELDEHTLIMHINENMDARASAITCMSERILPSYFRFSQKSLAEGCRTPKELLGRISYLKGNFGSLMPPNWQAFLEEAERNFDAIKPMAAQGYHIFSFDGSKPNIVSIIKACRDIIICTNHNLFLVDSANYSEFTNRMRENGILL